MMRIDQCMTDQCFTHLTHTNELTIFNTSAMQKYLIQNKVMPEWIVILRKQVAQVVANHGVEKEHLARLQDYCLLRPVIFIEWKDGTHILVDGNHRLVYAHLKGKTEILGWLVKRKVWKDFTIKLPPNIDLHGYVKAAMGREIPNDVVINVGRY